ncbi:Aculeacin-A acylase [Sinobacterium norvegicum]|uniref:Aculeacin-A acylase n=1 Tax=Sinobacterium norvegicum TaxID=1641715 RepID=A0ABM9ADJ8_9GAMM|nr:penicillin acylase family protein [Sinobacterium norvegicum]CAH0991284.1 Aculeacin-A acylase [Sinobacterium norvegicum]
MLTAIRKPLPILIASLSLLLTACDNDNNNDTAMATITEGSKIAFDAKLYRTEGGVPHIVADDWGSIGYGTGYAAAQDHFCQQSRNILKFRGELAKYFGADDDADSENGNGNLDSDFFFKLLAAEGIYDADIDPEFDTLFTGYAAGFNRYIRDIGLNNITDQACAGAEWVIPMTADDVKKFHLTPAFLPNFASFILPAKPPESVAKVTKKSPQHPPKKDLSHAEASELLAMINSSYNPTDKGSNGVAIGKDLTEDNAGLLFANPHLDWLNFDFRMYAMHQIIPGVSNMLGANQAQRAHVGFGTNGSVAWTNTVSTSTAYMFYKLDLVPGNPMAYTFDGEEKTINKIDVTAEVLGEDSASHSFYKAGDNYMVGGRFPWMDGFGVSLRIANEGARGFQGGAMAMAQSTTVEELKTAVNSYQSTPGINTIAADSSGNTLYGDLGPVINFTEQQVTDCALYGGAMYAGNSSACVWNTDSDSTDQGLMGASKQPALIRSDYVTNSNDSFWLANPNAPIGEDYVSLHGNNSSERTLRTRSGLAMIQQQIDGAGTFDQQGFLDTMLSNQHYAGQILRDDVVALCQAAGSVDIDINDSDEVVELVTVDLTEACTVLTDWDLTANLDSQGSHLFREFLRAANSSYRHLPDSFSYAVPYDNSDPVNTPRGLDTEPANNAAVLTALGTAVKAITDAGIALDAKLGDIQSITRNDQRIALPGGEEFEGVFNKMGYDTISTEGYPDVTGSSASWVMVTKLTPEATTVKGVTAYSQSSDNTSEHYADMTKQFAVGELIDIPYTEADVIDQATSTLALTEGAEECQDNGWENFAVFADENECINYFVAVDENRTGEFSN